jgi:hypothetical protein
MFLGSKVRLVRKADNLATIYELIVLLYFTYFTLLFTFMVSARKVIQKNQLERFQKSSNLCFTVNSIHLLVTFTFPSYVSPIHDL